LVSRSSVAFCLLLLLPGCATAAPEERTAYVLARPHAWVELTIADPIVPDVPPADDSEDPWRRPQSCSVSVEIDGEPWFRGSGYPQGETSPYVVETGFRFPVPVGTTSLTMTYGGCRVAGRELQSLSFVAEITAVETLAYEVVFDGSRLVSQPPRANTNVTLEDIYEAVTGRRSPAE